MEKRLKQCRWGYRQLDLKEVGLSRDLHLRIGSFCGRSLMKLAKITLSHRLIQQQAVITPLLPKKSLGDFFLSHHGFERPKVTNEASMV